MTKVLTFRVEIEGLETKIWRKIEITDSKTVADLAYTILASFDSLAYHLYKIMYEGKRYDCMVCRDVYNSRNPFIDATKAKLSEVDFSKDNRMEMEYDYGSPNTFFITYLGEKDLEKGHGTHYPYIIDGQGHGMLDDISCYSLLDIVNDTDIKGKSEYDYTPGYQKKEKYDYRDYSIEHDNCFLKDKVRLIKEGYEKHESL